MGLHRGKHEFLYLLLDVVLGGKVEFRHQLFVVDGIIQLLVVIWIDQVSLVGAVALRAELVVVLVVPQARVKLLSIDGVKHVIDHLNIEVRCGVKLVELLPVSIEHDDEDVHTAQDRQFDSLFE